VPRKCWGCSEGPTMANVRKPKVDFSAVCAVCSKPIDTCKVPGLHGAVRDSAAKATAR